MDTKHVHAPLELKLEGPEGSVRAAFSVFDVVDGDGDVVLASTFTPGQPVAMSAWGHDWGSLAVGKGIIEVTPTEAIFDGQFFLTTTPGRDHYETVKAMGDLQEYSWGFRVLDAEPGTMNGQTVRFIKSAEIYEVSPVLIGSNRQTHTLDIKSQAQRSPIDLPYAEALAAALTAIKAGSFDLDTLDGIIERSESRSAYRTKAGRVLSEANRTMLRELHGYLSDHSSALGGHSERLAQLLSATDPSEPKGESPAAHSSLALLRQQFDFTRARIGAL